MENTRLKILEILRRQQEATVEELTKALDLAPATVRRHLDILQRDGHVQVRPVRRETGRPHYAFSLTQAGEELFPQHYVRITNRLMDEIMALGPEDTSGKSGSEIAAAVFERMAERLARTYLPRVTGATLGERVRQVATLLENEGMLLEARAVDGDFQLVGRSCPCRRLAQRHPAVCRHDERLLSLLLDADIEVDQSDGSAREGTCVYTVRERRGPRL